MIRRDFLTKGAIAFGGALAGAAGLKGILDVRDVVGTFSLDVVTGDPASTIDAVQSLTEAFNLGQGGVRFEEHQLVGSHVGDIAFVSGSSLVDFRRSGDALSARLSRIARQLDLPRRIDDPVLLQFASTGGRSTATELHVYSGDTLIQRKSLHQNLESERIENRHGYVDLAISNGAARITAASCKHKTCVNMGAIGRGGQSLVCIPNQIRVAVAGRGLKSVDGIAS
jgi:hypothetical protein